MTSSQTIKYLPLFDDKICTEIENYARIVGMAIAIHLYHTYAGQHPERKAVALALAVSNELVGNIGSAQERTFLSANSQLVEQTLIGVRNDPKVCYIVSLVAYMCARADGKVDTFGSTRAELTTKLRDLGILLSIEQLQASFSLEALKRQAHEFELWALKN